jgi:hypothetical protein
MPNLKITTESEVIRWIRAKATAKDTSVALLAGELLKERMRAEQGYEAAKQRFLSGKPRILSGEPYPSRDELCGRSRRGAGE